MTGGQSSEPSAAPALASASDDILLVDDNPSVRAMVAMALRKAGYRCRQAVSGEQALAAVAQAPVALILLDLNLPGIDGLETARRIRFEAGNETGRIPIIGMTAADHRERRSSCLAAGMDDVIDKVALLPALPALLARFVRGMEPGGGVEAAGAAPAPIADDAALDRAELAARLKLTGPEVLGAAFADFETNGETTLAALARAWRDGHRETAADLAHRLAGGAAVFRLAGLNALLNELERRLRAPVIDDEAVAGLLERLAPAWRRSAAAFRAWLQEQGR